MTASQITFGRKTEVIADMLRDKWYWGMRHSIQDMDQREREYDQLFPADRSRDEPPAGRGRRSVKKMIARRRERMVLDSLRDLVRYWAACAKNAKPS